MLLTLATVTVVVVSRHGALDITTSTGLLVTALGLKLLELKTIRDVYIAVFLGWFVTLTQFLFDQSLVMAGFALLAVAALIAALIQFNVPRPVGLQRLITIVVNLIFPAVPVMVLLFLFFPRLTGPFFSLPLDTQATTGLSEIMEPGSISSLATSSEIAFRVDFDGAIPAPQERYWRAQVFWHFDGRRWLPMVETQVATAAPYAGAGRRYHYRITLEPHHHRWLFSLGFPGSIPSGFQLTREGVLQSRHPVYERILYSLQSFEHLGFPALGNVDRQRALQLPGPATPRIDRLVAEWRRRSKSPRKLADTVMSYFETQGFTYVLQPPLLGDRSIDRFLFETRQGFCEHYASAFVYLMRVAGVPARIVGGYLGGFLNPQGGFLEVYQANAHAWAEIWIDGSGWVRYDPTQAVAPRYLENAWNPQEPGVSSSLVEALLDGTENFNLGYGSRHSWWHSWRRSGRILWSDLDHRWHLWVLSYGQKEQFYLLAKLRNHWWMVCLAMVSMLLLTVWSKWRRKSKDPLVAEYRRFLVRLEKNGPTKEAGETPLFFADRAISSRPEKARQIRQITDIYVQAHYGKRDKREAVRAIKVLNNNI